MRSRDTLRGPFPFATLLDSAHARRFFPRSRGSPRRGALNVARARADAAHPLGAPHARPGPWPTPTRPLASSASSALGHAPRGAPNLLARLVPSGGETNASSARDAMAPDENAGAPVGFAHAHAPRADGIERQRAQRTHERGEASPASRGGEAVSPRPRPARPERKARPAPFIPPAPGRRFPPRTAHPREPTRARARLISPAPARARRASSPPPPARPARAPPTRASTANARAPALGARLRSIAPRRREAAIPKFPPGI